MTGGTVTRMRRIRLPAALVICTTCVMLHTKAQDAPSAAKASADKVAADDLQKATDAFAKALQERAEFDDAAKAFVTKVALRKLRQTPEVRRLVGAEKLEAALDRIRDTLSGAKGADAAVSQRIRDSAAAWLAEQARSGDPSVAANAALLLGDLRADGKPWADGSKRLAELAADTKISPSVRAAAVAGLARHMDDFAIKPPVPAEFGQAVTPALTTIVTAPITGTDPASRWLVSRALDLTAKLPPAASPELAKALEGIMTDPKRSTDERVRAAIALGRTGTKDSGIDVPRAVAAVRNVAEDALADSLATAKDRALAASLSNTPLPNMQPGMPAEIGSSLPSYPLHEVEVERDAWRLLKLSEAIARPKLKKDKSGALQASWGEPADGGLCLLLENDAEAKDLARQLRTEAEALVANPTASRVAEAKETIATWTPAVR